MIVVDANILISFVLGRGVRRLIEEYQLRVRFFTSEAAFLEAKEHLSRLLAERGRPVADLPATLEYIETLVEVMNADLYEAFESQARARLRGRDEDDWHLIAAALALNCPVWTKDQDLFGTGVSIWTTDRVEIYFDSLTMPADTDRADPETPETAEERLLRTIFGEGPKKQSDPEQ